MDTLTSRPKQRDNTHVSERFIDGNRVFLRAALGDRTGDVTALSPRYRLFGTERLYARSMNEANWLQGMHQKDTVEPTESVKGERMYTLFMRDFRRMPSVDFKTLVL